MAHATKQITTTYSAAYLEQADVCREASSGWAEYDRCMAPWEAGADAVGVLYDTTLALDLTDGRRHHREAGCAWLRAVAVVDATSPVDIPAVKTVLASKWKRIC